MRVERIMTRDVITVAPELPLKQVAMLLTDNHISGAPVCDADGAVVGVVSEADILRRTEGVSPSAGGRFRWLVRRLDGELAKVGARTAAEAMTAPALTIRATQQVAEAAQLMLQHRINRLPVVRRGALVGIVSRADILRAFERPDAELELEIREDVLRGALWLSPESFDVHVDDGVVTLRGRVATDQDADDLVRFVRRVPGVLDVAADLVTTG
jgi:CBS domain-containing protein